MKYPFQPELLDALPEELAELFRGLEDTLLVEICSRLKLRDELNEVTIQDIRALRSHGVDLKDIKKAIRKTTGISEKKLNELLKDVVERNQKYYDSIITLADVTKPDVLVDAAEIAAIKAQTLNTYRNVTASMGFLVDAGRTMLPPAKAYQWVLDSAVMQIESGAINYTQAIRSAVQQLAQSGIKVVDYESGHRDQIDVAVRRAVMTGVNQVNRKYSEQTMDFLQTDLVSVEAHAGARDTDGPNGWENHKAWQGKIYRWAEYTEEYPNASSKDYPDFERTCGIGDVQGILGANCRHSWSPFVEGVMEPPYTEEYLKHIDDGLGCTYDGKTYTAYEATQMQRRVERQIRAQKRLRNAYKAAGLTKDADAANIKLRRLNTKYKEFSAAAGLPEQPERMRVYTGGNSNPTTAMIRNAKSAGGGNPIESGRCSLVGTVDFTDEPAVLKILSNAEKELADLDYEVNYSVTRDGNVWRVSGDSGGVSPSIIPSDLKGSYSYHNHPRSKTNYSFSAEDIAFLIDSGEKISIASDDRFLYAMRRTSKTVEKPYDIVYNRFKEIERTTVFEMMLEGKIDPDLDRYHEVIKMLSKELGIDYVRKEKHK